jgi:hypothetical protein
MAAEGATPSKYRFLPSPIRSIKRRMEYLILLSWLDVVYVRKGISHLPYVKARTSYSACQESVDE